LTFGIFLWHLAWHVLVVLSYKKLRKSTWLNMELILKIVEEDVAAWLLHFFNFLLKRPFFYLLVKQLWVLFCGVGAFVSRFAPKKPKIHRVAILFLVVYVLRDRYKEELDRQRILQARLEEAMNRQEPQAKRDQQLGDLDRWLDQQETLKGRTKNA